MDHAGKVALITGGGIGIGRATALAFAKSGATVVVVDQDAEAAEAVVAEIRDIAVNITGAHFVIDDGRTAAIGTVFKR